MYSNRGMIYKPHINPSTGELEPQLIENEQRTIGENNKISLTQMPTPNYGVIISGYTEINDGLPASNEFKVDYNYNQITFNSSEKNKTVTIVRYWGSAFVGIDMSMLWELNEDGEVVQTLQEIVDNWKILAQQALDDFDENSSNAILEFNNDGADAISTFNTNGQNKINEIQTQVDVFLDGQEDRVDIKLQEVDDKITEVNSIEEQYIEAMEANWVKAKTYTYTLTSNMSVIPLSVFGNIPYNPAFDGIQVVYQNQYLIEGENYTFSSSQIQLLNSWTIPLGNKISIVLLKGYKVDLPSPSEDGSLLLNGSVGLTKLEEDVQDSINSIDGLSSDITTLTTNVSNIIDEQENLISDVNEIKLNTNPYNADKELVFGQEYLSYFHKLIMNRVNYANIKVTFSGDSTTAGDSIVSNSNIITNLFSTMTVIEGYPNISVTNKGHSGATTNQWLTTYLAGDMATNPDLLILRWGLNDATTRTISQFETDLNTALTTIRGSKTLSQLSIILMTPNTTNDTPNKRDDLWHKAINPIIRKCARDYQCCFIDTYEYLQDSVNGSDYMDNPFGDGRHIHPLDVMNMWIVSKIFEVSFPKAFKTNYSVSKIQNTHSSFGNADVSWSPSVYGGGITINRASAGFPIDGTVYTFKSADNIGLQINHGYNTSVTNIKYRIGYQNNWSSWVDFLGNNNISPTSMTFSNSYTNLGSGYMVGKYYKDNSGVVHLTGTIKAPNNSTNVVFYTLPSGFRPSATIRYNQATATGRADVDISSAGEIKLMTGDASGYLLLDGIGFLAEQ